MSVIRSYRDLPPLEIGGIISREGLAFQDHVAAGFCLDMLQRSDLLEVWCERLDDITLVWSENRGEVFEFVQAKTSDPDQLWSIAVLCKRDKTGSSSEKKSLLERSLENDRGAESCRFRVITTQGIKKELALLTLPLKAAERNSGNPTWNSLCSKVLTRVGDFQSANGNRADFWLSFTHWDIRHSVDAVVAANLIALERFVESDGLFLAQDQRKEIYIQLVGRASEAARTPVNSSTTDGKRFRREDLISWVRERAQVAQSPSLASPGMKLDEKLTKANLQDRRETALEARTYYRKKSLNSGYLQLDAREDIEAEASGVLNRLLSALDAGVEADDGPSFHAACLTELQDIVNRLNGAPLGLETYLHGFMYSKASRCVHRFRRVTT